MQEIKSRKPPFEPGVFLLRHAPITLVLVILIAVAIHRWWPISVQGLPPKFDVACSGTITSFVNGLQSGQPAPWQPRYHVDLPARRVDNLVNGKHIRVGSVDQTHGAFWLEDDESKAGRNIVSYFFRENRLGGSLALDMKGYRAAQVKKADCKRTPG